MSDRPTPRTDAINSEDGLHLEPRYDKMHDLAEQLERELADMTDQRDAALMAIRLAQRTAKED